MIIRFSLIPDGYCINLFGTIWTRDESWITDKVINHEKIHTAQQRELLFIPFYILYIIEWMVKLIRYRSSRQAYLNLSFEREAYRHGPDLTYLPRRRHYAWLKYLCKS